MSLLFLGLGRMGAPMASRLGRTDLYLYDPAPATAELASALGAQLVDDLRSLPIDLETVILMLPTSAVVESVTIGSNGLFTRLRPGSLVIDMSSSIPASTRRLAEAAKRQGIDFVDAPVSGGIAKAKTGELAVMAGGTVEAVARARAVIDPMSAAFIHVGPSGAGHAAKALNNLLSATNIAAMSEALVAATAWGIDPAVMVDVVNASTGRSQASEVKFPQQVLTGHFDSGFALELMVKDIGIALDVVDAAGIPASVLHSAADVTTTAFDELGKGRELDHTQVAAWYENAGEVSFRPIHQQQKKDHHHD
ncbi:3-hydroxyisobutyrate dehydrogenase [Agreia bicolorata]|uniref:3-hydroxyisobutyrate dehydrogenase n=1 Tax=Agreia bicolorata TaxID=110935 RepID=A0A1T4XLY2_9MICO|nr:NAD(P)-dependent oxidoreductase [Agreia bicolorata]SKA90524.1 3-hydroxyisobutyrate dehydrogenase [Agreia bicolorata]